MKCLFKKSLSGLHPYDEAAEEWFGRIKLGEVVEGEFRQPRNLAHHCKFFALLNLIWKNQEHYQSVDDILLAFKHAIGHGHWVRTREQDGRIRDLWQPHSISFAKMDQAEFERFYNDAITFVVTEVIPGLDRGDLERELMEFAA